MKRKLLYGILLAALALYLLVYINLISQLHFNWFRIEEYDELKLIEYDKSSLSKLSFTVFSSADRVCMLSVCENSEELFLKAGGNYFEEDVEFCGNTFVNLSCGSTSLHFSFDRTEENVTEGIKLKGLILSLQPDKIIATVLGDYASRKNTYKIFNFWIDDKLVRSVQHFFEAGSHELLLNESFKPSPGRHKVRVSIGNNALEGYINIPMYVPVDEYIIVIFSFCLSAYLAIKNKLSILNSFLLFISFVIFFLCFHFQISKNLGYTYLSYPLIFLFAFVFSRFTINCPRLAISKEAALFAIFATAICIIARTYIGSAILTSHYYLRQADSTYFHGNTNYFDELSYLGRPFTYPSQAFFMVASTLSKLLFVLPSEIIFNLHTVMTFLFALVLYLTTLKLKMVERFLVALLIFSNYLVLTLVLSSPLHTFAFFMLTLSVYFYVTNNKHLCILVLSIAAAAHLTMFVASPLFAYAANGFRRNFKDIFFCMIAAAILSSIYYLPLLSKYGTPYQILPKEKGYLQTYGLFGSFIDFNFFFPFIPFTIIFGLLNKHYRLPATILLLSLIFYMLVSYRMNILSIFLLPFLFVQVFRGKVGLKLFLLPPLASIFIVLLIYSGFTERCELGAVNVNCIKPMQFINFYTSSQDSVVTNPIYGHLEAYYGQRKVLADVFVEYADEEKYLAARFFALSLNKEYLESYNISIAVVDHEKNIKEFDKIYDNKLFKIYRLA